MSGELTHPVLAVPDLGEALAFYAALGFEQQMRQERPNPYAVVGLGDMRIHLAGVASLDPTTSLGNVIVVVPDADALYAQFAAGFRERYGRTQTEGVARILRPRKKTGTVAGFSVVDPGGNWLRVYSAGGREDRGTAEAAQPPKASLESRVAAAARLGDAKDDPQAALTILTTALNRFTDAPPLERARALLYRAELAARISDGRLAEASLNEADALVLTLDEQAQIAEERADIRALVSSAQTC